MENESKNVLSHVVSDDTQLAEPRLVRDQPFHQEVQPGAVFVPVMITSAHGLADMVLRKA
jgi:hypothetical protein